MVLVLYWILLFPQNGQQSTTQSSTSSKVINDSDNDIQEILPPGMKDANEAAMQEDNYEAVEMELDTEESCKYHSPFAFMEAVK